jgi:hypothetical protein
MLGHNLHEHPALVDKKDGTTVLYRLKSQDRMVRSVETLILNGYTAPSGIPELEKALGNNKKFTFIIGGIAALMVALLVFLTLWDPPAPTQEMQKDVTDDLFAS